MTTLLWLVACASDNTLQKSGYADGVGEGSIHGRVCYSETGTWLGSATVYTHIVSSAGELIDTVSTVSDAEGWYTLEGLPSGLYAVYIQYGSTLIDLFEVDLGADEEFVVPEQSCAGSVDTEVAAISADYDEWETVLPELGLGNYTLIEGDTGAEVRQFLLDSGSMAGYDAIFFAGGIVEEDVVYDTDGSNAADVTAIHANLQAYVEAGGVVFLSDWAYDVAEQVWPNKISFIAEAAPDDAQIGTPDTIEATVKDAGLQESIGAKKAQILLDLDAWPVMTGVGDDTTVYLSGDAPWRDGEATGTETDVPLLVGFASGEGRVYVSSWRAEANLDGDGKPVLRYLLKDL